MPTQYFGDILTRWKNIDRFSVRLLARICKDMVKVLKENSPGTEFPTTWTWELGGSSGAQTAVVYSTRLGHENKQGEDEGFLQIAIWQNDGTESHWVAPVKAKVLHWTDEESGQDYYSMGHLVRGIQARHFREKAQRVLDEFNNKIPDLFNRYMATGQMP